MKRITALLLTLLCVLTACNTVPEPTETDAPQITEPSEITESTESADAADTTDSETEPAETEEPEPDAYAPKSIKLSAFFNPKPDGITLMVGQREQVLVTFTPQNSRSGVRFKSSNEKVATVDENGYVRGVGAGSTYISAFTYNDAKASIKVTVIGTNSNLSYTLNEDGAGYTVTGCKKGVYTAHIPARYEGLPVTDIAPGVFKECDKIAFFSVEEGHPVFYAEDGVIFKNEPVKTLVAFPPSYEGTYYSVPEDTVVIEAYAFASMPETSPLCTLIIPEGVTTMGDYAFWGSAALLTNVHVPSSLVNIGKYIMQGHKGDITFIATDIYSAFYNYAWDNHIMCGYLMPFGETEDTVKNSPPGYRFAIEGDMPEGEVRILNPDPVPYQLYDHGEISITYSFAEWEKDFTGELRLDCRGVWSFISSDPQGNHYFSDFSPMTGLYGAGHTEESAILRGYGKDGELLWCSEIQGSFTFCFPDAVFVGVEGGRNTSMTVVPYEPVYVTAAGNERLDISDWNDIANGQKLKFYIVAFPYARYKLYMPEHIGAFTQIWIDAVTREQPTASPHYMLCTFVANNPGTFDLVDRSWVELSGMTTLMSNEDINVRACEQYGISKDYAELVYGVYKEVKEYVRGDYIPADIPLEHKIDYLVDGVHTPNADLWNYEVHLQGADSYLILVHETVHILEANIPQIKRVSPGPWLEGRAVMIEAEFGKKPGVNGFVDTYDSFDWSYLSPEDKADFFSYYYHRTNRSTVYPVGYHFLKYIMASYGDDVSARVSANMAAIDVNFDAISKKRCEELFKKCVEDATSPTVWQDFVRDVIEPSLK